MSCNQCVTISLVRMMIRRLRDAVNDLCKSARNSGNNTLVQIGESFLTQVDNYYGDEFYNHPFYRVAEYLDRRTVWALAGKVDSTDSDTAVDDIKGMIFQSELELPPRINPKRNPFLPASNVINQVFNSAKSADGQKSAFEIEYIA